MAVDLNAARAARTAARGADANMLQLGFDETGVAREWQLKPEMPIQVVSLLNAGQLEQAWRAMLVDPGDFDAMVTVGVDPTTDDLMLLVQAMAGTSAGN